VLAGAFVLFVRRPLGVERAAHQRGPRSDP
jgi:hypothetical protein